MDVTVANESSIEAHDEESESQMIMAFEAIRSGINDIIQKVKEPKKLEMSPVVKAADVATFCASRRRVRVPA